MAMEARAGDFIEIQACGEDAEQAVKTIAQILQKGAGNPALSWLLLYAKEI